MVKANEITNRSLKIKDVYLDGATIKDEEDNIVDLYGLLKRVFGDGATFTVSVSSKLDADIQV